ncbi:hypothetical protein OCH239_18630 [Roseivivax halodurans JCM 10272]|uniref:Uncharacterized protein n=1 Tax=Roseivivax halodurans JCM 10272 TaxID=1449350 RepID=X7E7H4_9RHOB|nr:hypothetical protein [Roseivivax halodurans]ETX12009.1 hypothetical protein OCH239_18630 [Roseivivax halodurans JCM 10272]
MDENEMRRIVRDEVFRALSEFFLDNDRERYSDSYQPLREEHTVRNLRRLSDITDALASNVMRLQSVPTLQPTKCGFDKKQANAIKSGVDDLNNKIP